MRRLRHLDRFGVTLLAVALTTAGAPASACVAMPDCPMTVPAPALASAPAEHCHGAAFAGDGGVLPPLPLQAGADCCAALAAQPTLPAPAPASPAASALADPPAAADGSPAPPQAHPQVPRAAPPLSRAAGRALLSLQQTFLI